MTASEGVPTRSADTGLDGIRATTLTTWKGFQDYT